MFFDCHNAKEIKFITRLILSLSHLREHRFKHGFQDIINPLCNCGQNFEPSTHFSSTVPFLLMKDALSSALYVALIANYWILYSQVLSPILVSGDHVILFLRFLFIFYIKWSVNIYIYIYIYISFIAFIMLNAFKFVSMFYPENIL